MRCWAKIKTQFEGFHNYPNAPEEVKFLRNTHRHIFHVTVQIEQFHDNRDIEYFLFQRWLDERIRILDLREKSAMSCEFMARALLISIEAEYPNRRVTVEVSEDGENGAVVEGTR